MSGITTKISALFYRLFVSAVNKIFWGSAVKRSPMQHDVGTSTDVQAPTASGKANDTPIVLHRSARLRAKQGGEVHWLCIEENGRFRKLYELPNLVVSPALVEQAKRRDAARRQVLAGFVRPVMDLIN